MIAFDEYRKLDATEIASVISKGEISAREVLECAIERAVSVDSELNSIVQPLYDYARKYIQDTQVEGPLAGVPFLLKDLLTDIKGRSTTGGSATGQLSQAQTTSTMVKRFSKMGLVFMGKTNTPEFGLLATTEPLAFGATKNPWDLSLSVGGSSGGSAAAVAAGIVPIASAGDGGGSIRIPAACCGLFGFKPSRGVNPHGPNAEEWDGAVSEHVITRSVRDSITVLKGTIGSDDSSHTIQVLPRDFLENANTPVDKPLTIGFSTSSLYGGSVHPDCRNAVVKAAQTLEDLGHNVEEATPLVDGDMLLECYSDIYTAHVNAQVDQLVRKFGYSAVKIRLEPLTLLIYHIGNNFTAGAYVNSKKRWSILSSAMAQYHERYDIWVSPVMAVPPFPIGGMLSSKFEALAMKLLNKTRASKLLNPDMLYKLSRPQLQKAPFTQLANLTGQPAMSVPLFWNENSLPVGVQFVAGCLRDRLLFQLASQLEIANPWFNTVSKFR